MKSTLLLSILAISIIFYSCGVKLKKEVFDKIDIGMSIKEVNEILGEPAKIKQVDDSNYNYYYYIHHNIFQTDYAVVRFYKDGFVNFKFYGNPD